MQNFIKSTNESSASRNSGATSLTPIGTTFVDVETKVHVSGDENAFVSFERTDIFQVSFNTFFERDSHIYLMILLRLRIDLEYIKYYPIRNAIQNIKLIKILTTVLHQKNELP